MSSGIVGVVLWGTIIVIAFFLMLLGRAVVAARSEGPRQHLREPVLKGWDETHARDGERPPR